jgi:hypothetical protein
MAYLWLCGPFWVVCSTGFFCIVLMQVCCLDSPQKTIVGGYSCLTATSYHALGIAAHLHGDHVPPEVLPDNDV